MTGGAGGREFGALGPWLPAWGAAQGKCGGGLTYHLPVSQGVLVRAENPPPLGRDSVGLSFQNAALLESSQAFSWLLVFPLH